MPSSKTSNRKLTKKKKISIAKTKSGKPESSKHFSFDIPKGRVIVQDGPLWFKLTLFFGMILFWIIVIFAIGKLSFLVLNLSL